MIARAALSRAVVEHDRAGLSDADGGLGHHRVEAVELRRAQPAVDDRAGHGEGQTGRYDGARPGRQSGGDGGGDAGCRAPLDDRPVVLDPRSRVGNQVGAYGVSQGWISKLMARYRTEGETVSEPRSRRSVSSPSATPPAKVEHVLRLRRQLTESGLDTIGWHLTHRHQLTLSRATIDRILARHGTVTPDPSKRPKSSYIRFGADQPNETWQSDFTHYRLSRPDGRPGTDVEI